ncbi:hypothetical protein [Pseudodesulfovibrio sp. zrk46]|uniref:hypothetical protein n=1 Tax=Pseudodesulfovibrio sp. zrk46 TaxID=2725288 RepID=UPI001449EF6B|nr:hypothetical protein [Pseudodesulfovibrio sp. zrk46]QJB56566.1 hypothetical protein HFN16_09150 [Pseudodesulfovibrio sp. zrk46]
MPNICSRLIMAMVIALFMAVGAVHAGSNDGFLPPKVSLLSVEDTIAWKDIPKDLRPANPYEGARELPGERLGLIGPIIAKGGAGKKPYIVVFDAAGTLVGGMLMKEVKKRPDQFRYLLQRALERSQAQNGAALQFMRQRGTLKD